MAPSYAENLLNIMGIDTTGVLVIYTGTGVFSVFDPMIHGPSPISGGVTVLSSNGQGMHTFAPSLEENIVPALRCNSTSGYDIAYTAQYFPQGRAVVLWDTYVLPSPCAYTSFFLNNIVIQIFTKGRF